ncbi:hypothetical protein [Okeania sp.]|uniref:hypothetical protein n=1 Tax=Okeania sp. TaxID=3100323 RepID=UPI002B4AED07|nr:hypothetical protein [Okeania sp.]MEB3342741.1 hypothetical protein [Okeania sp.]
MGRWRDGEMGRWGDGEMGRWGDGEMGGWGDSEYKALILAFSLCPLLGGVRGGLTSDLLL